MIPFELREGTVFAGDYRVVELLARGGMGAVYVVEQESTGKRRALKVMHPLLVSDDKARERFVQEAKVGALVDSVHVVEVIAAGVDKRTGMPWLCMELLEGETLQERIVRLGALPPEELSEVATQLKHALALAHGKGLVHRDLKPENLFLERPRRAGVPFTVKILDFGIAKLVQQAKGRDTSGTQALGSPLWMAPEQANAGTITPATDVWAIGLIAFASLTGVVYWRTAAGGGDLHLTKLLVEILVDPLTAASTRAAELRAKIIPGAAFDTWLGRCIARKPEERFEDAGACLEELVTVLATDDFASTGETPIEALPMAPTAQAASVSPSVRTEMLDYEAANEPIVRGETAEPEPEPQAEARGGMGIGQIAALLGGAVLVVSLAVVSGFSGLMVFSGDDEEDATVGSLGETDPPPLDGENTATKGGPMNPIQPTPVITPTSQPDLPPLGGQDTNPPVDTRPTKVGPAHRPPPISRSAAGRQLYDSVVRRCWQEELARTAHGPTRMRIELQLGATGTTVRNLSLPTRWRGGPFARCVVGSASRVQFTDPPSRTTVTLNLPGAR